MTRIEKETIMSALAEYKDEQRKKSDKERKRGELGKAATAQAECDKANALLFTFAQILIEPCGTVLI